MYKISKSELYNFLEEYAKIYTKEYDSLICNRSDKIWHNEELCLHSCAVENMQKSIWYYSDLLKTSQYMVSISESNANDKLEYTFQYFFFVRLFIFFKGYNLDYSIVYYLLNNKFNNLFYLFSNNLNKNDYFFFLQRFFTEYLKLLSFYNRFTNFIFPLNYLNDLSLSHTQFNKFSYYIPFNVNYLLKNKDLLYLQSRSNIYSVISSYSNFEDFSIKDSNYKNIFCIYFLRVQRRYNKRRYSKVRVYSRPSFFGGICLGSIFISCFWGGTIKSVDWITMLPVVVNMNVVLLFLSIGSVVWMIINENRLLSRRMFGKFKLYIISKTYTLLDIFLKMK